MVFPAAQIAEEAILGLQNRRQIVNEFTNGVVDGQIQEGSVTSLSSTTDGRSDVIDVWYMEGLETGNGFQIGISSSIQQVGDVAVRELKGNLFVVLKRGPLTLLPQGSSDKNVVGLELVGY